MAQEWKIRHFLKDGREIGAGVHIEITPQNIDTILRAMERMDDYLAKKDEEAKPV